MQRMDMDNNREKIEEYLLGDTLGRNKNLNVMLSFLINVENQLVINLDDNWGTGKTVFLKQIEYLNKSKYENIPNIHLPRIKNFQNNYEVFYFNSWEHDLYNNPLESLINSLLMKIAEVDEKKFVEKETLKRLTKKLKELGILLGNMTLKSITAGQIDLGTLEIKEDDLSPIITSIEVKRKAINEIVNLILESSEKKLLIVVDELDRCKPTYAIEFLEVIKHFFINDDVVFLFGTNKKELSETIKGEYGSDFNGYKYLNRFFDFEFSLPEFNKKDYLKMVSNNNYNKPASYTLELELVADYFNFTLRDINRFVTICDTFHIYLNNSGYYIDNYHKYMILPFIVGLKIHNGGDYLDVINGEGWENLESFYNYGELTHIKIIKSALEVKSINWSSEEELKEKCRKELFSFYDVLSNRNQINVEYKEAMDELFEVLSMMSNHTT